MKLNLLILPFTFLTSLVSASVIGIDFGTDWFKVSIVKPGVPLDIVLNRESKRKTNTIVTLRDQIRYFGSDSIAIVYLHTHV
jgi:hypoxia up-regulated 1